MSQESFTKMSKIIVHERPNWITDDLHDMNINAMVKKKFERISPSDTQKWIVRERLNPEQRNHRRSIELNWNVNYIIIKQQENQLSTNRTPRLGFFVRERFSDRWMINDNSFGKNKNNILLNVSVNRSRTTHSQISLIYQPCSRNESFAIKWTWIRTNSVRRESKQTRYTLDLNFRSCVIQSRITRKLHDKIDLKWWINFTLVMKFVLWKSNSFANE